jgi:phenylacetate-coenzyme A ligase PaaK-like adenylate-forming protein
MGSVVITPYYPYRECMPVLRYDTRDVVRTLADQALDCALAGTPATSKIQGKAAGLLRVDGLVVTTRDVVEVLEALPTEPWPVRFDAAVQGDHILLTVPAATVDGLSAEDVERRFEAAGIPVRLLVVTISEGQAAELRPLRADLVEATFTQRSA